jgi:uncharacterized protein involved in outer membrane biogenesis
MTLRPHFKYAVIGAIVVAVLGIGLAFFPWHVLRGPLASYASHRLQRDVAIGDLGVDLGRITRVQLDDLSIGNVQGSSEPRMAYASRMVLFFSVRGLLSGEPDYLQLTEPDVLLEKNAEGAANWRFDVDGPALWPEVTAIDVDRGVVRYRDPALRADLRVSLQTKAAEGEPSSLRFSGRGKLRGEPFELDGRSQGLVALRRGGDPYLLAVQARSGRTAVSFDGTIIPGDPENLRGTLHLRGPDLSLLYPIVPSPLPWTPAYSLSGELAHAKGLWSFRRFKGIVGDSDLSGDVEIDVSTPRAKTTADLKSARFNYKDLGGFVGLPPGEPLSRETAEQQQEARRRAASPRVLPDKPFEMAKLRAYDADVRFRGTSVKWGDVPMDNLVAHLVLQDGVLRFDPLDFGVADGHIVSNVVMDVNRRPAQARGQVDARNVELKRLFPRLAAPQGSAGRIGGRARFRTEGDSVAELSAAMDGQAAVSMRGGEASTLALVLTNLDLARAALLLLKGDENAEISCAVAALRANAGVVQPDLLVIDSTAEVITGEGTIDLRQERYDLRLKGDSKRPSLLALRGPIVIGGTFKTPTVGPALGPIAARVGAAVGLGAVAPPLAILPLVDLGDAADIDCRAANEEARVRSGTSEPIVRGADRQSNAKPARKKSGSEVSNAGRPPA